MSRFRRIFRDIPPAQTLSRPEITSQLLAFNAARLRDFGRAPDPDNKLPIEPSGVGGDVQEPEE